EEPLGPQARGGAPRGVEPRDRLALGVEEARRAVQGEAAERAPARARHTDGVEGRLERAREARAAEGIAPRREARVDGLECQAEALRVQLELLGEVLERRPAPPGARQDDAREERVGGSGCGRHALAEE